MSRTDRDHPKTPQEYNVAFGKLMRWLRRSKQHRPNANRRYMMQAAVQTRLITFWTDETETYRDLKVFDIEMGKVRITRILAEMCARALEATPLEHALLLEAAGYDGWAEYVLTELYADYPELPVAIGNLYTGTMTLEDVEEVARLTINLIKRQLGIEPDEEEDDSPEDDDPPES
jgi:hypothetical protein